MTRPKPSSYGIALFIGTVCIFTITDAVAKHLITSGYPVLQAVWARYIVHLLLLLGTAPVLGIGRLYRTGRIGLQVGRASLMLLGTILFMSALQWIPLADAYAISYVSPLIVTALAAWILRESVGPRRWAAVTLGFIGVLIVIQPTGGSFHWALLLPLGMATTWASFQIATRALSGTDDPLATLFYTGLVGTALSSVPMPFIWTPPTFADGALFALLGVLGLASHILLVRAYEYASASVLAPFTYCQLPWSIILGFLLFEDFPAMHVFLGTALILASSLYVLRGEKAVEARKV